MVVLLLARQLPLLLLELMLLEALPLQPLALLIQDCIFIIHLPYQLQEALLLRPPALQAPLRQGQLLQPLTNLLLDLQLDSGLLLLDVEDLLLQVLVADE